MKQNRISIKWKIFGYLFVFVVILLILLWLFQIVFLDSFYKSIKTSSVKSSTEYIVKNIDSNDIKTKINEIAIENQLAVQVVNIDGTILYETQITPDSLMYKMSEGNIKDFYNRAKKSGGSIFHVVTTRQGGVDKKFIENVPIRIAPPKRKDSESVVYAKVVEKGKSSGIMVMASSFITPVNSTVETLRIQLAYISLILIMLSIILAFFIARKISKPIIKINNSAKKLAKGDYKTKFDGKGYYEIDELNDTLNYAASELSKVEGLRRELIANISHDLRTPLTMITGYGEVIRDIPGENTPENIQIIIEEAKHLSTLVSDILDISKIQSGSSELNITRFNLTQSIGNILLRYSKLIENEGFKIEFKYDREVFIKGDNVKISQVIYNLINNAITYTGDDKRVLVNQVILDDFVKIEVVDTGEGIKSDMLPLIWDRYYKSKSHKRSSIGTGLGLSIVKGVINMHHGEYGVESEINKGSVFWVKLKIDNNSHN